MKIHTISSLSRDQVDLHYVNGWRDSSDNIPIYHADTPHAFNRAIGYARYKNSSAGTVLYRGQNKLYPSLLPSGARGGKPAVTNQVFEAVCNDVQLSKFLGLERVETKGWREYNWMLIESVLQHYCAIGKAVCRRTEKGAAVMASEYLNEHYPDAKGFSPRSLRRMRDFYRTYENYPTLLPRAMKLGWIQNVVIMEADLTMDLREWYMKAAKLFGWSKTELISNISAKAHENIVLPSEEAEHKDVDQKRIMTESKKAPIANTNILCYRPVKGIRKWWHNEKAGRRRCGTLSWERSMRNRIFFMRC